MSMQSVLGVVGGVVGSFFGYPQLGFMVGSLVGGLLTPKEKTEGPRLDDLKVQVSTYGSGIPILYGTERIGGNVVWSTDKIETSTTEEAGKGGGAEHTSYRYFVHMRIALCETPRDGSTVNLIQIFQDGKLKWDARSGVPVAQALASEENLFAFFTLYQGHADQLPDPVEEIYAGGPGSVPPYRGVVSISMKAIECPGGRVPQFSFVLSSRADVGPEPMLAVDFDDTTAGASFSGVAKSDGSIWNIGFQNPEPGVIRVISTYGDSTGARKTIAKKDFGPGEMSDIPAPVNGASGPTGMYLIASDPVEVRLLDLESMTSLLLYSNTGTLLPGLTNSTYSYVRAACDPQTGKYFFTVGNISEDHSTPIIATFNSSTLCDDIAGSIGGVAFYSNVVYAIHASSGILSIAKRSGDDGSALGEINGPTATGVSVSRTALYVDANGIYAMTWVGSDIARFYKIDTTWTLLAELPAGALGSTDAFVAKAFTSTDRSAVVGPFTGDADYYLVRFSTASVEEIKVSEIIADQCDRAFETRYDVSGIPDADTVHGYKLQNPASARNNIDPLLTAFAIYAVDEDGLIKFKKYEDITSVAAITYDELGQSEDGSEPSDAMPLNRTQEIDLPRSVAVSYVEETFDYQTATEKETRQVTEATEDLTIELPIATNANRAKKTAQMILFARWRAQNTRSFKASRKYAFLSPGDGVTVEYPRGTSRLWRIMSMTDTGALIELTVEPGDAEIYTQTAIGATGYVRQEVDAMAPPTRAEILDMPIVRDEDNNAGLYVAMDSYGDVPAQAELFVGDSDANLESRGTVSASAPIGYAETVLADWQRAMVDETNLFTVNIGDDTVSSVTRDVLLAGGGEYWAYGAPGRWEIGASASSSSLGSGRFILSRHLRGQFGTERNAALHQINDTFVLLRAVGMLRPNSGAGAIGQSKSYRAISKGRKLDSDTSQTYVNTGEGLMPMSPINLRRSTNASNDITLTWDRRSRLAMNNSTGTLPLGETTESYSVEFYTSSGFSTLAGTLTTSTASLTITSAQQTAFGLTPGATVYVHVRQVSDSVGAGHHLQATA